MSEIDISKIELFFGRLTKKQLLNSEFMEKEFIPQLGLNNELLNEQPKELNEYFGKGLGLRIWQYPNQFAKYSTLIGTYAENINSYLEIGSRYGGTFIFHYHYLKSLGSKIKKIVSVDLIDASAILSEYIASFDEVEHLKINSNSKEFHLYVKGNFFDLVFIDGDHSYEGVKSDAELTRDFCNIQVFHDISSDPCPGVLKYWEELKESHHDIYSFYEFTDQYDSVNGSYLGIGVAVRKQWLTI